MKYTIEWDFEYKQGHLKEVLQVAFGLMRRLQVAC